MRKTGLLSGHQYILLCAYVWHFSSVQAIPNTVKHPDGFFFKNNKINFDTTYHIYKAGSRRITGDEVCARYYKPYFDAYKWTRANLFAMDPTTKGFIPQYRAPYTRYPLSKRPLVEVPVEAILGEIYEVREKSIPTGISGCYVACQDLRKTIEWVISAKTAKSIHVRVKIFFQFACPAGMIAQTTQRMSWRESEDQAHENEAVRVLEHLPKRSDVSKLKWYSLVVHGLKGEITGCQCIVPTDEERRESQIMLAEKRQRTDSFAWHVSRKKTKTRPSWRGSRKKGSAVTTSVDPMDTMNVDDISIYDLSDLEGYDELEMATDRPDRNNDNVICYDTRDAVNESAGQLQASLFDHALSDFDQWFTSFPNELHS